MRQNIRQRLDDIESRETDWASKLDFVDYVGLDDYEDGNWAELHFDSTITVVRNHHTGEIRGVYNDRRTDEEILAIGGDLAYL